MNAHNDIWMMVLAHLGVLLLFQSMKKVSKVSMPFSRRTLFFVASLVLLGASTQIKRATLLLVPVWVMIVCLTIAQNRVKDSKITALLGKLQQYWADIAGLLLFLPLLTDLSRQFHPWYLLWSFSFVPFMRNRVLRSVFIIFTFTSALRYIPILWVGVYSEQLISISKVITWSALPLAFLYWVGLGMMKRVKLRPTL
jgi:flagellar biosynthesis protein FliQ